MKKLLFAALLLVSFISFAQSKEEIQQSKERIEKISKLENPKTSSVNSLDDLNVKIGSSALESSVITPLLQNLYYRSIGETTEGIADVTVKKPTLKECEELAGRILLQTKNIDNITPLLTSAAEEAKSVKNPLKIGKITSSLGYAKTALSLLGEETLFQSKAIKSIITTLKSSGNL